MNYNITYNENYKSHEVQFDEKPSESIRTALKELHMRWHYVKKVWYGCVPEHKIIDAILTASQKENEHATIYTDGYLGGGAIYGSKSNKSLYGADLSKAIRTDLKTAGIKNCSVKCTTYSGGQTLTVTVKTMPDDYISFDEFYKNFQITPSQHWIYTHIKQPAIHIDKYFASTQTERDQIKFEAAKYTYAKYLNELQDAGVKYGHAKEMAFTSDMIKKLYQINSIISAFHYDESNSMVDYFHTNFYYDISIKPQFEFPIP